MTTIVFVNAVGDPVEIDAVDGMSLMENAVQHMVAGIDADCGGACACATCQVYIDTEWFEIVG